MLKKLFKHEMRSTAKTFMWLYIAFLVISLVCALFMRLGPNDAGGAPGAFPTALVAILMMLYVLATAAIAIGTVVVIILRFYRNLLGDEGYLMMTLPVSRNELILSKLFVSVIWSVCSAALVFLSVLIIVAGTGTFAGLSQSIGEIITAGAPLGQWIVFFVIALIVSCFSGVLTLFAAMSIGPNLLKNRLGGSILAFIIIIVASQIINFATVFVTRSIIGGFTMPRGIATAAMANGNLGFSLPFVNQIVNAVTLSSLIGSVIVAVACWFLTRYMLTKKLNLA